MIEVSHVNKTLKHKEVLKDITCQFEEGKVYLLKGHNGCGKTMLLRAVCGLIHPDSGSINCPENITFGVIIENPSFVENETAWQNLEYLAKINHVIGRSEIEDALKAVNLLQDKDKKVKTYSLGMKQRLAICQAIMENPNVLLLDEPFNALDPENVKAVEHIIREEKQKGKIVIIAAHMVDQSLEDLFDEVITMAEGKIVK